MTDVTQSEEGPEGGPPSHAEVERRAFLKAGITGIGGVLAAAYAIPAVRYVTSVGSSDEGGERWVALGAPSAVETGVPTLFQVKIEEKTAWLVEEQQLAVYLISDNGTDFLALSNVCTHLGCRVRWVQEQLGFFCPCHNAVFDRDGNVVDGPPPRPLDRFETKVEEGSVWVKVV